VKNLIFLLFLFTTIAQAQTCPEIDYRDRFTSLRDQSGNGLCWAFAGSALIEEQMCLEDPENCDKQVSVIDGHRCYWDSKHGLATKSTGAFATGLYTKCALDNGVCSEEDSPFVTNRYDTQDRANGIVVQALQKTLLAKIKYGIETRDGCIVRGGDISKFTEDFGKIVKHLIKNMADEYLDLNINYEKALLSAGHYTDALKGIFISEDCRQSRFYLKNNNLKPVITVIDKLPYQKKLNSLITSLQTGRSSSIGLCGRRARKDRFEDLFFMSQWGTTKEEYEAEVKQSECGAHSVIANGMRMKDGRCQIHIRNSWGSGSGLEGWEDAENILNHSLTLEYLSDGTPPKNFYDVEKLIKK
jgi:hypothetical protein